MAVIPETRRLGSKEPASEDEDESLDLFREWRADGKATVVLPCRWCQKIFTEDENQKLTFSGADGTLNELSRSSFEIGLAFARRLVTWPPGEIASATSE